MALADGRLYYRTEDGTMLLIEPNPKEYVERGRFEQPDRTPDAGLGAPGHRQRQTVHPRPGRAVLLRREGEVSKAKHGNGKREESRLSLRLAVLAARPGSVVDVGTNSTPRRCGCTATPGRDAPVLHAQGAGAGCACPSDIPSSPGPFAPVFQDPLRTFCRNSTREILGHKTASAG